MSIIQQIADREPFLALYLQMESTTATVPLLKPVKGTAELLLFDGIEWLTSLTENRDRICVFIEEDIAKLRAVQNNSHFLELLQSSSHFLCYQKRLPCFTGGKQIEVFSERLRPFFIEMVQQVMCFESLYLEGKNLGVSHFQNVFDSLYTFENFGLLTELKGNFQAPWLVVGGNVGSEEDWVRLRELQATHYVISAGSATKRLLEQGIQPDFATLVDPDPHPESYIEDTIPTFFQLRANTKILQKKKGIKIWSGLNNLYPFEGDVIEASGLPYFVLDSGYDALTFAVAIVAYLGAIECSFLGVSLDRETLNDLLSRIELARYRLKEPQSPFSLLDKQFNCGVCKINHMNLDNFCDQVLTAETEVDFLRTGIEEGYLRPLRIFTGNETIEIDRLKELIKKSREIKR